jgi:hypothetical protein
VIEKGQYLVAGHPTVLVLRPRKQFKD